LFLVCLFVLCSKNKTKELRNLLFNKCYIRRKRTYDRTQRIPLPHEESFSCTNETCNEK
jgi:hypothetical protein